MADPERSSNTNDESTMRRSHTQNIAHSAESNMRLTQENIIDCVEEILVMSNKFFKKWFACKENKTHSSKHLFCRNTLQGYKEQVPGQEKPVTFKRYKKNPKEYPTYLTAFSARTHHAPVKHKNTPNQDSFAVYCGDDFIIGCVCDGHGKNGHYVSMIGSTVVIQGVIDFNLKAQKNASTIVFPEDGSGLSEQDWIDIFDMAEQMCKGFNRFSGACATAWIITKNWMECANCGDTTGMWVKTKDGKVECERLTIEDKPDNEEERLRIEAAPGIERKGKVIKGRVVKTPYDYGHRVVPAGLAISRAIGDVRARPFGVVSTPHVRTVKFDQRHLEEYVMWVAGSDGVWDEIPEDVVAADLMDVDVEESKRLPLLIQKAQATYRKSAGGYADDATLVVIDFQKFFKQCTEVAATKVAAANAAAANE